MKIDHLQNCEYQVYFHRYYRVFLLELFFATHRAEGLATATDFCQEICLPCCYSKPTLVVLFHSTHYQYHIHIPLDMYTVYAASPGSKSKN